MNKKLLSAVILMSLGLANQLSADLMTGDKNGTLKKTDEFPCIEWDRSLKMVFGENGETKVKIIKILKYSMNFEEKEKSGVVYKAVLETGEEITSGKISTGSESGYICDVSDQENACARMFNILKTLYPYQVRRDKRSS